MGWCAGDAPLLSFSAPSPPPPRMKRQAWGGDPQVSRGKWGAPPLPHSPPGEGAGGAPPLPWGMPEGWEEPFRTVTPPHGPPLCAPSRGPPGVPLLCPIGASYGPHADPVPCPITASCSAPRLPPVGPIATSYTAP